MKYRYIVRCEEGYLESNSLEEAISDKEYFINDCGYENVELYDTVEDKFI